MDYSKNQDHLKTRFVHVAINDREPGVYYLEEHPGKEMLESLGRRDGPIVKFSENALWSTHMQLDFLSGEEAT